MGKAITEDITDTMQDILGLGEGSIPPLADEIQDIQNDDLKHTTTPVTQEQLSINQELAKLDLQIETLMTQNTDINLFYANLDDELTEEEQNLEFSDKAAYLKLVSIKANDYVTKNSNNIAITTLKEQKQELERIYDRQTAIVEVSTKYPNYNHEKMLNFYNKKLSADEQGKILAASKTYAEVYENTFKKFIAENPTNIHSQKAPNLPNLNQARKQSVQSADIDNGFMSHDAQLKQALGL